MEADPKIFLNEARRAVKEGNFEAAVEQYEYFFDHALDNDPASYYGVRLSYCLDEWSRLGEKHPEAKERLEFKRNEALDLLKTDREAERFHDFVSICEYLKCPELPVEEFIKIHESDTELAKEIVRFIWDVLVSQERWDVCVDYLNNPKEKYSSYLLKFDQAISICKSDESLGGEEFEEQIKGWCIRDISNMLLVLKNSDRTEECREIIDLVKNDFASRSYGDIHDYVVRNAAL